MMVRGVEDFLQHRLECNWCHSQAMAQEEADAVAALMAAASGDVRSEAEQPPEEEGSPPGMLLTFCGQPFFMFCLTTSLAGNGSTFMGNVQAIFQGASFLHGWLLHGYYACSLFCRADQSAFGPCWDVLCLSK